MEKSVVEQLGVEFFNEKYKNTIVVLEEKLYFIQQANSTVIKPTKQITDWAETERAKTEEWETVLQEFREFLDESGFTSHVEPSDVEEGDMDEWTEFREKALVLENKANEIRQEILALRIVLEDARKDLKKEYTISVFNFETNKTEKINANAITDWKCFWDFPVGYRYISGQSINIEKDTRGHRAHRLQHVDDNNERAGLATKLRWWVENERWKQIINPTFPSTKDAIATLNTTGGWIPISLTARIQKFQNNPRRYAVVVIGANVMLLDENAKATNVKSNLYALHKEEANLPDYENIPS